MKNRFYTSCFILLNCLAIPFMAQAQLKLNSFGVGVSYWKPSLDYWNNRSMLLDYNKGTGATLSGRAMPTASIDIGVLNGLSVGVRAAYWKSSAASDLTIAGINRSEKLTLAIIPVSLDLKYSFATAKTNENGSGKTPSLVPYVGIGLTHYFIQNDFSRQVVSNAGSLTESHRGGSNGIQLLAGIEKKLVKILYLGLDVRYHIGSYNQAVRSETSTTSEKVSLSGIDAGLSLRLKFNK